MNFKNPSDEVDEVEEISHKIDKEKNSYKMYEFFNIIFSSNRIY